MKPSTLTQSILDELNLMVKSGRFTPDVLMDIAGVVGDNVESWLQDKTEKLDSMVQEWEATMGDGDKTFYSLGIRRAIDVIRDESAFQQLPVLEKPDTKLDTE